jgi:hypothetical protein
MDWTKHEIQTLIEHHLQQANNLRETAAMFADGDADDKEDGKKFINFAHMRERRARQLQAQLEDL